MRSKRLLSPRLRTPVLLTFCLLSLGFLGGCGENETRVSSGNRDGVLHWGNASEPHSLDPHIATGVPESKIMLAVMEGLVLKDSKTLQPVPGVAESWDISEDGRVYTFHMRENARWSNGDALTAEDFVWSWWRGLQPAVGNLYAYMFFSIENAQQYYEGEITDFKEVGVKALDKHTLQVTLENPTPYFLQLLDHNTLFPVHRATIEKFGEADERGTRWTFEGNLVGNGAFQLDEWKINRHVSVIKNPYYWRADSVKLNKVVFYPTENITTEERMYRAGQLHYTYEVPVDKVQAYREQGNDDLQVYPYLGSYFYRFNTNLKHFSDKRVRRALALAVDRKKITEHVLKAGQTPSYAITPPDTMGYFPESDLRFDPVAARKLLADAGYPNGEGFPASEILYNTQEEHRKVAVSIQQMWKEHLNIDVKLLNQEWKVYLDSESNGDYEISRASWIGDYVDPNNFLELWLCDGGNNRTGWCNEEFDRLIAEEAPKAKTHQERLDLFTRAEKILIDEMPVMPIYIYTSKHLIHPAIRNFSKNILNQPSFKDMYLEAPEAINTGETH